MKVILFCFSVLVCLFLAAGCGKDSDETIPAAPATRQYILTYAAEGNGSIKGINVQTVKHGDDANQVTAVPAANHHFVGWDDGVATANRIDQDVTADLKVTARFAIDEYNLTYTAEENGSIKGDSAQKVAHGENGNAVTAVPADGYQFVAWSDGLTAGSRTDSNVTAELNVTARFSINRYTLTYSAEGNGSIEGISVQTVTHGDDANQVTAVAAANHHFVGWSDGIAAANRTDQDITADIKVAARFAAEEYSLTYIAEENGSIKGDGAQKVAHGENGNAVTAVPADGYHFVKWSDGLTAGSRTDSNVTAPLNVTADFALNQYTLTYSPGENGSIDGISSQTVDHGGETSTVTAVADKGYYFVSWSDGLTTEQRVDSNVTGDLSVSAVFAVNTYSIGGSVSGLIEGTQVILQNNGADDLKINTNGDFIFVAELLNADTYEVTVLTQQAPPGQTCTVTSGAGTIIHENITDIVVACIPITFSIGGIVAGIPEEDQIILRNNDTDDLVVNVNGSFTFATPLEHGSTYKITVHSQPERPNWGCKIENATGVMTGMNVTDIIVDCYPEAFLQAKAGIGKIRLNWNSQDFNEIHSNKVVFNICRSQEEIPPDEFRHCRNFEGGVIDKKVDSPLIFQQLDNNTPYWFQIQALAASGSRRTYSNVVMAIPVGGLNDSGIDWCADENTNFYSDGMRPEKTRGCDPLAASHPNQDALHGRDASARARNLVKTGNGAAGFDFTKVCRSGDTAGEGKCPPNPSPGDESGNWACTRDNVTGLVWEVKTDSGLQNKKGTYTWYNKDEKVNGDGPGVKNGGKCEGSKCDTMSYVNTINDANLCGISEWRLPTKRELLSIVDSGRFKPSIDSRFFPNTLSSHYWSISPNSEDESLAWQVYFLYGEASLNNKNESHLIRLVSGRTVTFGLNNP